MNPSFVAADVRRLKLLGLREIRASLRRLLRFRGSMREDLRGGILPMHRALVGQQPSWLPVSSGILPAEHLGGRDAAQTGRLGSLRAFPGSRRQLTSKFWRCSLSMNLPSPLPRRGEGGPRPGEGFTATKSSNRALFLKIRMVILVD